MNTKRSRSLIVAASALAAAGLLGTVSVALSSSPPTVCRGAPLFADARLAAAVRAATEPPAHMLTRGPLWISTETCARLGGDLACARYVPRLAADNLGLVTLAGLECMTALRHLVVAGNRLADLAPIASLRRLESLDATRNAIDDLTPLCSLPCLRELYLWNNSIADASPLMELPQLSIVDLGHNPLDCATQAPVLAALRARGVTVHDDCSTGGAVAPRP